MAYINNQWLEGRPLRNRKHSPIPVTITPKPVIDSWDRQHGVKASFLIERPAGDYQFLLFTEQDLELLGSAVSSATASTREKLALAALGEATDGELVEFLGKLLQRRRKKKA